MAAGGCRSRCEGHAHRPTGHGPFVDGAASSDTSARAAAAARGTLRKTLDTTRRSTSSRSHRRAGQIRQFGKMTTALRVDPTDVRRSGPGRLPPAAGTGTPISATLSPSWRISLSSPLLGQQMLIATLPVLLVTQTRRQPHRSRPRHRCRRDHGEARWPGRSRATASNLATTPRRPRRLCRLRRRQHHLSVEQRDLADRASFSAVCSTACKALATSHHPRLTRTSPTSPRVRRAEADPVSSPRRPTSA